MVRETLRASTLLAMLVLGASGAVEREAAVKAELLERFTRYIEWPPTAFPKGEAPFTVCLVGGDPFGGYLEQMARERKVKDRHLDVRRISDAKGVESCQLVFISGDAARTLPTLLAHTAQAPVLTVGDTNGFAHQGVLINLYVEAGRVRFEINASAARKSGLTFSPQLLRLAKIVDS